tara:strand:+ start:499 stop:801 length:303 start_codon:yes stop_codon:yes gene_type:complete
MSKDKEFLNFMFTKPSDLSFVHAKQSVKVDEMIEWLNSKRDWANTHAKGFISWDVLTTKADANKLYSTWNDYLKPEEQATASNHMPDRAGSQQASEDLPF